MNNINKIKELEWIIKSLQDYKKELNKIDKLSDNIFINMEKWTIWKQSNKNIQLTYDTICAKKQEQRIFKKILESSINVSIEEKEYILSEFHNIK